MSPPILATKLFIPPPRPNLVARPHLIERLDQGHQSGHKLTLISAPAGFGKSTLASEWLTVSGRAAAWLSLDEGDNDPARFLTYFIAALRTVKARIGEGLLSALQSPQPPPTESILTILINELTAVSDSEGFILVLDDYHLVDAAAIDEALAFLLEHLPPQIHLVITTREDPNLPLARLRARGQLTELRAADLRFTPAEAATFLNQVMGLNLSEEDVAALEVRTEGWIAGLQLAAISMRGHEDNASFVRSFTGSHQFVLDYLVEEVLQQQPTSVQAFLLQTSILDRLCGPLCDAVCSGRSDGTAIGREPTASGQETLEYLQQANLFIVPLDNERRWYRYHQLFADLLRQRLQQQPEGVDDLHQRASSWYEAQGLEIEAFRHAAAANDVARAARLLEGEGMPLHYRGAVGPVLDWLASLPTAELDTRPSLWVRYASALWVDGQIGAVEPKLQAAEAALQGVEPDDATRDLIGRIAARRATLAAIAYDPEMMIAQSRRALDYLHPNSLPMRTTASWTLGLAYQYQGDRRAAGEAFAEAISTSEASGNTFLNILAATGLGQIQEMENQLAPAAGSYRRVLQLAGDPPLPAACEAALGLGRILYEWNDLEAAQTYGQLGLDLARPLDSVDTFVVCEIFLARLKLARGDVAGASAMLAEARQSAQQHAFELQIPEIAAVQVLAHLQQGNLAAADELAQTYDLPLSQARVHLARGEADAALARLQPLRQQQEARDWQDERLKVMVLQAIALKTAGNAEEAVRLLGEALATAEPGGFVRTFVDEGPAMAQLLSETAVRGLYPDYAGKLLAAFSLADPKQTQSEFQTPNDALIEPLSQRELEVLLLIAQGLSNHEISERLFLALSTVKGHNRIIFSKLQVQNRTQAVVRARELGLL